MHTEGIKTTITLLFDMNILWTNSSPKSKIAEIDLSTSFATRDLISWLNGLYPIIADKMKTKGLQSIQEDDWEWFLKLMGKSLNRRSGVVFVARKKINFVEDRLVLKLGARNRI
ncbi:MAG: hypothetical protein ACFFCQ_06530 [Promethearchaeota archaeon]